MRYALFFISLNDAWRNSLGGASYLCAQVADRGRFYFRGLAMGIVDSSNGGGKGKAETLFHGIYCKVHCLTRAIASIHFGV